MRLAFSFDYNLLDFLFFSVNDNFLYFFLSLGVNHDFFYFLIFNHLNLRVVHKFIFILKFLVVLVTHGLNFIARLTLPVVQGDLG
jgi:hypothetical protein